MHDGVVFDMCLVGLLLCMTMLCVCVCCMSVFFSVCMLYFLLCALFGVVSMLSSIRTIVCLCCCSAVVHLVSMSVSLVYCCVTVCDLSLYCECVLGSCHCL